MGGIAHLTIPTVFTGIMPAYLPWHKELVFISGLCELFGGILIWIRSIRRWIGVGLIVLCVAVFPANVNMAINQMQYSHIPVWLLYLRLPLQGLIIFIIYKAIESNLDTAR